MKETSISKLLTAAKMAKQLKVSASEVRKALKAAKVKPTTVKAGCSYYDTVALGRIKKTLGR